MAKLRFKNIYFLKLLRFLFLLNGFLLFVSIILAFTTLPFWGYYWLGTSKSELKWKPEAIILLGGGGMPSESNLMRSWFTAKAAAGFPESIVYVLMPGDLSDSLSTPIKMKNELILRGVKPENIRFENLGTNTRSQALNCGRLISQKNSILLITSPENMRRSVLSFMKVGFEKVNALPAFEDAAEADFSFVDDNLGGNKMLVPDIGKNTEVRYQVWNHMKYEILIVRECIALCYYKLRGWI
jgi:uncharacterized SAM-binding protein YcdF (DUF218 family)